MKKILSIILGLLLIPQLSFAAFSVPLTATSTANPIAYPAKVNGIFPSLMSPIYTATSTTATSTFANGISLTRGCLQINSTCLTPASPGGSVDDVQLNNGVGGFGGSSLLHFDPNTFELTIASGFISLSDGFLLADVSGTPGIGGNVTAIGGSVSNNGPATGGAAGSVDLTGGDAGGSGTGGQGGSIFISGGVNSSNSSADGGQGMTIFGVGGASTGTHVGGASGSINLSGDDASASTAGGHGGSLASTANGIRSGGNLDLSGGLTASGGSITMTNGAGSINTTGTGSIGFGVTATRTTLQGSATGARTVTMPDLTTTLAGLAVTQTFTGINTFNNATYSGLFTGGPVGVGTSTPYATLSVQSGASTGDAFVVATSSLASIFGIDNDGHTFTSGPKPAISSCGTGTGTVVGNDQSGTITTATAAVSCTMTFSKAYRNTPTCTVTDNSLVGFADVASISTTAVTFGISSALTGGNLFYQCTYNK